MVIARTGTRLLGHVRAPWLRELANAIVDLVFPPRCGGCRRLGSWLCEECIGSIEAIHPPICLRCGRMLHREGGAEAAGADPLPLCGRCGEMSPDLDAIRAFAYFAGPLREAIHQLKYDGVTALAAPLGQMMAGAWAGLAPPGREQVDAIVPVPLHRARERERGYNQAALLAREMGRHLGHPIVEDVLRRCRATLPQVDLDRDERRTNVHGAFRCAAERLRGRSVLLVDDVCTTGATLEAAASALRMGGATAVMAYTLARAK